MLRMLVAALSVVLTLVSLSVPTQKTSAWTHGGGASSGNFEIPSSRVFPWALNPPGVTYNGGIPLVTNIISTLSPCTQPCNDAIQINSALATCGSMGGGVVKLTAGNFGVHAATQPIFMTQNHCVLRGAGPGTSQTPQPYGEVYLPTSPQSCGIQWASGPATCTSVPTPVGTGTFIVNLDYATVNGDQLIAIGGATTITNPGGILFTADAARLDTQIQIASNTGIVLGQLLYLDQITEGNPEVYFDTGNGNGGSGVQDLTPPGCVIGSAGNPCTGQPGRCFFQLGHCQCANATYDCARTISQVVKPIAISGTGPYTVTLADPLSYPFTVAANSMVSVFLNTTNVGIGVEELSVLGGTAGDGGANIAFQLCDSCWARHIDSAWGQGTQVIFNSSYKSELRDSFIHESMNPVPGGGGYLTGYNSGAFGNLMENNIMWAGDKSNVMRNTGGGNVVGYNYMDDLWSATFPDRPEAGVNAGHYTTPHFELLEGNYSQSLYQDTFWGNSIYITNFRNLAVGARRQFGDLPMFNNAVLFPMNICQAGMQPPQGGADYVDGYHIAISVTGGGVGSTPGSSGGAAGTYANNFVGNMLGLPTQMLAGPSICVVGQTSFLYENISSSLTTDFQYAMWDLGNWENSATDQHFQNPNTYLSQLRQGNWDWVSGAAQWFTNPIGSSGSGNTSPMGLDNSLYLPGTPAFFTNYSMTFPWFSVATGTINTLPAKARFEGTFTGTYAPGANGPNACANYDSTDGVCLD